MSFWREKTLDEMTRGEWESLCDGCGRCCLMKIEDEDTGELAFTTVACTLFNEKKCACKSYKNRAKKVEDCVPLTPEAVRTLKWLPNTCAYKLINEGKPLYEWHHLVSGSRETVHEAGFSVKGLVTGYEHELKNLQELEYHLIDWEEYDAKSEGL